MIVKATVRPFDVEVQRSSHHYVRVKDTRYAWVIHIGPLKNLYSEYKPVGPTMLTEWEEEASTSLLDGP